MKKNIILRRVLTSALVASTVFGTVALAEEMTKNSSEVNATVLQPGELVADIETIEASEIEEAPEFVEYKGLVSNYALAQDALVAKVTVGTPETDGIIANLDGSTMVFDTADLGTIKSIADLEDGMEISLLIPANSPMTLSLPPMTSDVTAIVIHNDGYNADVVTFDEELMATGSNVDFEINENTVITDIRGSRKIFTSEDVKNSTSLVFTSENSEETKIVILANDEFSPSMEIEEMEETEETYDYGIEEDMTDSFLIEEGSLPMEDLEVAYVGLRTAAEELGYDVEWTSNEEPVIISKDDSTFEIMFGSAELVIDGDMVTIMDRPVSIENNSMVVSADLIELLK